MDVVEFRESIIAQIRFASSTDGTSDKEEFLNYVSEMLVEAEQLDDMIEFLPFEESEQTGEKFRSRVILTMNWMII